MASVGSRIRGMSEWDESKHPRDTYGRFGTGGGPIPPHRPVDSAQAPKPAGPSVTTKAEPKPAAKPDTKALYFKEGAWAPERVKLHEQFYKAATKGVPVTNMPTVYMTGGGASSGKTTALLKNPKAGIPDEKHAAHIDPDGVKKVLPEFIEGVKKGDLGAAAHCHEESSDVSKDFVARAIRDGHDVVYDSTGDSGIAKLEAKVKALRDAGAKHVDMQYVAIDPQEALRRAVIRENDPKSPSFGRHVNPDVLMGGHRDVTQTALNAIERGTFDTMKFWDNNGKEPKLIATYDKAGAGLKIVDQPAWDAWTKQVK